MPTLADFRKKYSEQRSRTESQLQTQGEPSTKEPMKETRPLSLRQPREETLQSLPEEGDYHPAFGSSLAYSTMPASNVGSTKSFKDFLRERSIKKSASPETKTQSIYSGISHRSVESLYEELDSIKNDIQGLTSAVTSLTIALENKKHDSTEGC